MAPVSKTQFFEIIDRLVKIEDHILNFGFIESNMKVLKYLVKFGRFEYHINDVQGRVLQFLDFFHINYQHERNNILTVGTIVSDKLDKRFRRCPAVDYYYKYSIKTLEYQPNLEYNIVLNVYYSIHLYDYDKYVRDYYAEHPEQYQISNLQIKKKYWEDLNRELIKNRFNPINIEKFENWGFEL
jgi:hypothetical protein